MKILIVLASILGVGLCALFPSGYDYNAPAKDFPKYLAIAKAKLHGLRATDDIFVASVRLQVQGFIQNVKIFALICFFKLYDIVFSRGTVLYYILSITGSVPLTVLLVGKILNH